MNARATNMVPKAENHRTNKVAHCEYAFVRDETAGTTRLVSVARKFHQ